MPDHEHELVESLTRVIKRACDVSPEARTIVRTIGHWLTRLAENPPTDAPAPSHGADAQASVSPSVAHVPATDGTTALSEPRVDPVGEQTPGPIDSSRTLRTLTETVPLRIGDAQLPVFVSGSVDEIQAARRSTQRAEPVPAIPQTAGWGARDLPDLTLIARRCRIKAAACRAIVGINERNEGSEQELGRCKTQAVSLLSCDLWMDDADATCEPTTLKVLAASFDNVAAIAEGLHVAIDKAADRPRFEELMHLLAEAQSALRRAVEDADLLTADDTDQDLAFRWLRVVTEHERVFIRRYMRESDRAEPSNHADLAARIAAACSPFTRVVERERESEKLRKKVDYHAKQVRKAGQSGGTESDWRTISDTVERLGRIEPATSVPLREILLPIMDLLPEDLDISQTLDIALDSAQKYRTRDQKDTGHITRPMSSETLRVRDALRGKRVVIVGGEEREYSRSRIEAAFELAECEWATTSEHGSSQPLVSAVERPGTALVLVLIRLVGHQHVDDVTFACKQRDIPLVRVPAGYGVTQVAQQIMEQQGDRLGIA
ncbi:MAG: hypothetical protein KF838_00800 [Phycisphaeraceae bacterium]|nr:MAG: hypothetical protein KF838_00800 [Phycisphaeraceae bacterium]